MAQRASLVPSSCQVVDEVLCELGVALAVGKHLAMRPAHCVGGRVGFAAFALTVKAMLEQELAAPFICLQVVSHVAYTQHLAKRDFTHGAQRESIPLRRRRDVDARARLAIVLHHRRKQPHHACKRP